jgi:hypothetical protein
VKCGPGMALPFANWFHLNDMPPFQGIPNNVCRTSNSLPMRPNRETAASDNRITVIHYVTAILANRPCFEIDRMVGSKARSAARQAQSLLKGVFSLPFATPASNNSPRTARLRSVKRHTTSEVDCNCVISFLYHSSPNRYPHSFLV